MMSVKCGCLIVIEMKFKGNFLSIIFSQQIRVNLKSMVIIPDDYQFAESNKIGSPVPYATGGDCYSASSHGTCRRGSFMVDLTGTGLKIKDSVRWRMDPATQGANMYQFQNINGLKISAKCGGWCGHCKPTPSLKISLNQCQLQVGKSLYNISL